MSAPLPPYAVFCDFDGTITAAETFALMMKDLVPEVAARILPQLYKRQLTLRSGVRQVIASMPAHLWEPMIHHADHTPIRPGLPALLDFLDAHHIPLHVVSGGVKAMVERVLEREGLRDRVASITAMTVTTAQGYLHIPPQPYESDEELVAKVQVMATYPAQTRIAIGDSLTDINMALAADVVFARDRLVGYLTEAQKPFQPWTDFFAVQRSLAHLIAKGEVRGASQFRP